MLLVYQLGKDRGLQSVSPAKPEGKRVGWGKGRGRAHEQDPSVVGSECQGPEWLEESGAFSWSLSVTTHFGKGLPRGDV